VLTIRASRLYSLGACLALIRDGGEQGMRGGLAPLLNRVVEPTGFLYAPTDCPPGTRAVVQKSGEPLIGPAPFGACRKGCHHGRRF
jgi:hypothetical protein